MAWTVPSVRGRARRIALRFIVCGFSVLGFSLVCLPSLLIAQTISPQIVEFNPSADHGSIVGGVALVASYELRFYTVGGTQRLQVIRIGKPAAQSDGKIRFNFAALLGTWPVDGTVYVARVAAVGPGGATESAVSNQFVFPGTIPPPPPPPACSYTLAPSTRTIGTAATTGSVVVTAASGCTWTASSSGSWLTIRSGASGAGSGTINYSVTANGSSSSRSATIRVGTATFNLTQTGECSYALSPTTRAIGSAATTGSVGVTAGSTCSWSASSSAAWLKVTSSGSGTGNGTVNYSVAANSASAARSATLTVGTAHFTVTQTGSCVFAITPTSRTFTPASAAATVTVTVASGCAWTATRSGSWLTITSGTSGTGNGTVTYRVSANTGSSSRTGTLTVAGQPVTVTQSSATTPPNAPAGLRIVTVR